MYISLKLLLLSVRKHYKGVTNINKDHGLHVYHFQHDLFESIIYHVNFDNSFLMKLTIPVGWVDMKAILWLAYSNKKVKGCSRKRHCVLCLCVCVCVCVWERERESNAGCIFSAVWLSLYLVSFLNAYFKCFVLYKVFSPKKLFQSLMNTFFRKQLRCNPW